MKAITHCPTCGQVMPRTGPKRVCFGCGERIGKHGKWMIGADGRIRHRDCMRPNGYPVVTSPEPPLLAQEANDAIRA